MSTQIKNFTQGNITKQLVIFAWPLFLSNLMQIVYNMTDMVVVGKVLGEQGISSVSIGGDVLHFLTFVAMGFSSAGQVLIARYIGAKEQHKIGTFVGTMSGFMMTCAAVISVVAFVLQDDILGLMNTPEEAYEGAASYATVCTIGLVFIYGYNIVSAVLRGMGDSKHPFIFVSISAILNIVLDVIFVIGMDLGPGSAALATVISQAVSFLCCTVFLARNAKQFELDFRIKNFISWDKPMLGALLKLGIPMAIKSASVHLSKLFVNSWINSYGVAVSAFSGVASKVAMVANLISMSMNTVGATMIGQNIAAKEFERVKKILKQLAIITLTISTVLSIIIYLFPTQIFGFFTEESTQEFMTIAVNYVPIAFLMFYGAALRGTLTALINGSGSNSMNFLTAILDGIVLRIGLAVLFGLVLDMQYYGFWLGDALAGFTPFWIGIVFYFTGAWKKCSKT